MDASSKFKGINDRKKYEKARRLKETVEGIRNDYNGKMKDKNDKNKQLGTAAYLIDKLALRYIHKFTIHNTIELEMRKQKMKLIQLVAVL